ncbi:MAG: BatA and WFA domain-containing protein [Candidatus Eisenbacteria bacterium]|nr:BatA and WFA domain-containing protein [Candidatus Eisenbacteria bacterium]
MSFLNPLFLLGALGGAVPLLIHLLARKKAKKVEFSSVEFLEEAAQKEIRKLKLRQLLLLVFRVLAIVFFAIGLARPSLNVPGRVGDRQGSAVAIIFDNSLSMSYETDDGSCLELAKEKALDLSKSLSHRDEAFLILGTDPPVTRFDSPVRDPVRIGREIEGISASEMATDIPLSIEIAARLLGKSGVLNKEIFVFSDMQKTGFEAKGRVRLDKGVRVFLVQPDGGARENLSIEKVGVAGGSFASEELVKVTVRNDSQRANKAEVKVYEGGTSIGEGEAAPGPDSQQEVSIPVKFGKTVLWGKVELSRDRLRADDIRYFLLPERPLKVLIVRDSPRGIDFLSLALNPWGEGEGYVRPVVKSPAGLAHLDWSEFKVVILDGVSRLDELSLDKLSSFAFSGGGVLVAAGDGMDAEFYSTKLLPRIVPSKIAGVEEVRAEGSFMRLRPTVSSHPVFQSFAFSPGEALPGAKFSRVLKIELLPGSRVIAEFASGMPAIIEGERALFLATSTDGKWNDLVMNASFAPLLHEMVYFLSKSGAERELLVGNQLEIEKPSNLGGPALRCVDTKGNETKLSETSKLGKTYLTSEPIARAGIYSIEAGSERLATFQVNVDPRESRLESYTKDELRGLFPDNQVVLIGKRDKLKDKVMTARAGQELSVYFFGLVLLLLTVELVLSRPGRSLRKRV